MAICLLAVAQVKADDAASRAFSNTVITNVAVSAWLSASVHGACSGGHRLGTDSAL